MNIRERVLSTVVYADIFDFPLTRQEIVLWLPGKPVEEREMKTAIRELLHKHILKVSQGFYFLYPRTSLPALRKKRQELSGKKMMIAQNIGKILSRIPTVGSMAVTGGLSMDNADGKDDIDICITASEHTVWVTRFLITVFLDMKGMRRKPHDLVVKDKICLNMFWGEGTNPVSSRDWYSAHEALQIRVIFDRQGSIRSFLLQNRWIEKIFPSAWKSLYKRSKKKGVKPVLIERLCIRICRFIEPFFYFSQLVFMNPKRTTEVIEPNRIRFHPQDNRPRVLRSFDAALRKYHVPLDKKFRRP